MLTVMALLNSMM